MGGGREGCGWGGMGEGVWVSEGGRDREKEREGDKLVDGWGVSEGVRESCGCGRVRERVCVSERESDSDREREGHNLFDGWCVSVYA